MGAYFIGHYLLHGMPDELKAELFGDAESISGSEGYGGEGAFWLCWIKGYNDGIL
jgi:hypothetical protein